MQKAMKAAMNDPQVRRSGVLNQTPHIAVIALHDTTPEALCCCCGGKTTIQAVAIRAGGFQDVCAARGYERPCSAAADGRDAVSHAE